MSITESTGTTPAWTRSSYSNGAGGECVEVATNRVVVHIRDSKAVTGPILTVSRNAWAGFIGPKSSEHRV